MVKENGAVLSEKETIANTRRREEKPIGQFLLSLCYVLTLKS